MQTLPVAVRLEPARELQLGRARDYIDQARAQNTLRAYRADWADFIAWCERNRTSALPCEPAALVLYLTELAESAKISTLTRRLSAISQAHQMAGQESPTCASAVRLLMAGMRRARGTAPQAKRPILVENLREIIARIPDNLLGRRDRALLLLGFSGAFRRSELVALNHEDMEENRDGLIITIRRSKTDPEGQGRKIGIPRGKNEETCPITALCKWLEAGGITTGAIFRGVNRHGQALPKRLSGEAVALIVKRRVSAAGFNQDEFSGHSLRAGLATSAAMAGKSERAIMRQTGHRSLPILRRYIREGSLFRDNAAEGIGL